MWAVNGYLATARTANPRTFERCPLLIIDVLLVVDSYPRLLDLFV